MMAFDFPDGQWRSALLSWVPKSLCLLSSVERSKPHHTFNERFLDHMTSYDQIDYIIWRNLMLEPVQFAPENGTVQPIAEADKIAAIVKAVVRAADAWGLSNAEAAALFDVPGATWSRMKAGTYKGVLDQDKVTRASLLIGLFKGLRLLFNGPLTYGWPKTANTGPGFNGRSPVQVMCDGGIPAMMKVRQHIDALRGGV
ncbi:MAG: hypothetical protein OXE82_06645 [Rhodobacter sp.]|nr:hypothetical protein [Rhodobacter sp.]